MSTVLIVLLVILLLGGIGTGPYWAHSSSWGWGPSGIIWILFVIVLFLALAGRL